MKPKSLIKFVEENAEEIFSLDPDERRSMMISQRTCVLRPLKLPIFTKLLMSQEEKAEYIYKSCDFVEPDQINNAVQWVKDWVSK